jgi:NTE family protein
MLVDGGVVENIPLKSMKTMKSGPNLVVHFGVRRRCDFRRLWGIPGRWRLLARMLTPGGRRKLPALPGPIGVLRRCLVMNQTPNLLPVGPRDLVLTLPAFPGATFLDFDRHFEVFEAAYTWGLERIDQLVEEGDPALAQILATVA